MYYPLYYIIRYRRNIKPSRNHFDREEILPLLYGHGSRKRKTCHYLARRDNEANEVLQHQDDKRPAGPGQVGRLLHGTLLQLGVDDLYRSLDKGRRGMRPGLP